MSKLPTINAKIERPAAGYVNSCKKGCRLLKPDHVGRKNVQIIVMDAPVIMDAIAPSLVARLQVKAAKRAGVIEVP